MTALYTMKVPVKIKPGGNYLDNTMNERSHHFINHCGPIVLSNYLFNIVSSVLMLTWKRLQKKFLQAITHPICFTHSPFLQDSKCLFDWNSHILDIIDGQIE